LLANFQVIACSKTIITIDIKVLPLKLKLADVTTIG